MSPARERVTFFLSKYCFFRFATLPWDASEASEGLVRPASGDDGPASGPEKPGAGALSLIAALFPSVEPAAPRLYKVFFVFFITLTPRVE